MTLPSQQPIQKGVRPGVSRGRGQAYNLTAKEAEASNEVMAGNILIYSIPFLSLFDYGASHCFLSSTFTTLHAILMIINNHWGISTGNGVITSNKICKDCVVRPCDRKLKVDMLVLDTGGYEVIIGMTLLSKYHIVIDCKNKKVIFRIQINQNFNLLGKRKPSEA